MAKYYGMIGFAETVETSPGIWKEHIKEYPYYGDLVRSSRRLEQSNKVNDDINLSNDISIVADPFARENFHAMRYVTYLGTKWKVTNVDVQYPRLVLSTGGIYHENET
jgi:hypothetical protein